MPNFTVAALKMWAYSYQNRENDNFWYKFAPKGKFLGSTEKVEYRSAQLQTFLYAMTP